MGRWNPTIKSWHPITTFVSKNGDCTSKSAIELTCTHAPPRSGMRHTVDPARSAPGSAVGSAMRAHQREPRSQATPPDPPNTSSTRLQLPLSDAEGRPGMQGMRHPPQKSRHLRCVHSSIVSDPTEKTGTPSCSVSSSLGAPSHPRANRIACRMRCRQTPAQPGIVHIHAATSPRRTGLGTRLNLGA